ncbi:MAG: alpha/beta hydrolase [Thermoleophilia bacterium]|nr:alpha/beta hydrolase [Thermoleophilia bacterium]
MMALRLDLQLTDGRTLVVHDTGPGSGDRLTVLWHNGSPHTGALLEPLIVAAAERDMRLISYARPGYGGSSPLVDRSVANAAADVEQLAAALDIDRFATAGASGGGPHALACAALLPHLTSAVATIAGIAPCTTEFDWFDGMAAPGGLRAALKGRAARTAFAATDEFDPASFVPADYDALDGAWQSLGRDASAAGAAWPGGLVDDDIAFVAPWGFELTDISAPALFVQGMLDRVVPEAHGEWQADQLDEAELWLRPLDGHVSVLDTWPAVLDWLAEHGR